MRTFRFVGVWVVLTLWVGLVLPRPAVASEVLDLKVERREFPVKLEGNTYTLVGYLYYRDSLLNRPVQILLHGITYNHRYWDMPEFNGQEYSYARYMARRNHVVLALDMLGTGESDKPDGDWLDLPKSASALHQVAQQLQATAEQNTFKTLIYVGHSNGALISTFAQAWYGGAQAVVNTGWLNTFHKVPVSDEIINSLREQGPYIRIPGEMRSALFYDEKHANPAVIGYDNEVLSDTVARGQFNDLVDLLENPEPIPSEKITVPVLVQLGDNDLVAPASYAEAEAREYPHAPSVTVETLTNTGHVFNGHYGKEAGWARIDAWIRSLGL